MSIAFLFPGQGSQSSGMFLRLPRVASVAATLQEASDVLGRDVRTLDDEAALATTDAVQLALFVASIAGARALRSAGLEPAFVAGHSVGAFAAAVTAEVLSFADGLRLVALRGTSMACAYPSGYGMGAVTGLDERAVAAIADRVNAPEAPVFIANVNAPDQIVVSGVDEAVDRVLSLAHARGARMARAIPVRAPAHCPLLSPIAAELDAAFTAIAMYKPVIPYVSNRGGRILRDADAIRDDLITSVAYPVRWHDATTVLCEAGTRLFIEMPPGHVLSDLAARTFPCARALALEDAGIDAALACAARLSPALG